MASSAVTIVALTVVMTQLADTLPAAERTCFSDTKPGVLWGESRQQGLWVNNAFTKSHEQAAAEVEQAQVASFSERHPAPSKRRLKRGCENWLKWWQEDYEALLELVHAGKHSETHRE